MNGNRQEVNVISLPDGSHKTRDVGVSRSQKGKKMDVPLEPLEGMNSS